jgi:hypothetical protein
VHGVSRTKLRGRVAWYNSGLEMTKWKYFRDDIATLDEVDSKMQHWGAQGWELVSVLHTAEIGNAAEGNILAPKVWMLIFKQPTS